MAVFCVHVSAPAPERSYLQGGAAINVQGGASIDSCTGCKFTDNIATWSAAAIYLTGKSKAHFTDSLFQRNIAQTQVCRELAT